MQFLPGSTVPIPYSSAGIRHTPGAVYATRLEAGREVVHRLAPGRHAWVQVTRGALTVGPERLAHGDGAAISGERAVTLTGEQEAEALLFDLP